MNTPHLDPLAHALSARLVVNVSVEPTPAPDLGDEWYEAPDGSLWKALWNGTRWLVPYLLGGDTVTWGTATLGTPLPRITYDAAWREKVAVREGLHIRNGFAYWSPSPQGSASYPYLGVHDGVVFRAGRSGAEVTTPPDWLAACKQVAGLPTTRPTTPPAESSQTVAAQGVGVDKVGDKVDDKLTAASAEVNDLRKRLGESQNKHAGVVNALAESNAKLAAVIAERDTALADLQTVISQHNDFKERINAQLAAIRKAIGE